MAAETGGEGYGGTLNAHADSYQRRPSALVAGLTDTMGNVRVNAF